MAVLLFWLCLLAVASDCIVANGAGQITNGIVGECKTNNDCKDREKCDKMEQKCVDPCVGRCGKNTICTVKHHIPNCECEPGHVGNPVKECVLSECSTHYDCADNRTCIDSMCVDPCTGRCGSDTVCEMHQLLPHCSCKPGYTGNPLVKCERVECMTNDNCPTNRACVGNKCVDPCHGRCGTNTECLVHQHVPGCICKPGYTGNPLVNCTNHKLEMCLLPRTSTKAIQTCADDSQCAMDKSCVSNTCVDPCTSICCQGNTECLTTDHEAKCVPGKREKRYIIPKQYWLVDWFGAMSECDSKGMRLASVLNLEENNKLKNVIEERLRFHGILDRGGAFWLAGSYEGGSWRWRTTGDTINYTDWYPGGRRFMKQPKPIPGYHFMTAGFVDANDTIRYGWFAQEKNLKTMYVCEYFI